MVVYGVVVYVGGVWRWCMVGVYGGGVGVGNGGGVCWWYVVVVVVYGGGATLYPHSVLRTDIQIVGKVFGLPLYPLVSTQARQRMPQLGLHVKHALVANILNSPPAISQPFDDTSPQLSRVEEVPRAVSIRNKCEQSCD